MLSVFTDEWTDFRSNVARHIENRAELQSFEKIGL